jgi:hypothetical protein
MHKNESVDSEHGNELALSNDIKVDSSKTPNHDVFLVYRGSRHWKRLSAKKGQRNRAWVERRMDGPNTPASPEDIIWLNDVWENPDDYPKVRRFPRIGDQCPSWDNLPSFNPEQVPKTKWLIKSFLAEGSIQLVFGERGSFKSTLLLAAAKAIADGEEFLGRKTRRRRVLYLDYENPADIIKARNDDLGLDLAWNQNFKVWNRFGPKPIPRPEEPRLEAIVEECVAETGHGPWIIFDSWASLLKPGEGGEFTGQIVPIYSPLRKLADLGATITVLDHSRKYEKGTIYGGQDKEAKADSIHKLLIFPNKARPLNPIIRVDSWLKRAAPQGEGSFAFEVQSEQDRKGNWHIVGLVPAQDPEEANLQKEIGLLRNLIKQNPTLGQEKLAELAKRDGIPRDKAINLLKSGIGRYWQLRRLGHNEFRYSLL